MSSVTFIVNGNKVKTTAFEPPMPLSELLISGGFRLDMPCGGKRSCGKCVVIARGELSEMDEKEKGLLSDAEISVGTRLACFASALGDVELSLNDAADKILTDTVDIVVENIPLGMKYGFAVDIGTTTVAVYFYRLSDGVLLDTLAYKNPQSVYGADVISRLEKSLAGKKTEISSAIKDSIVAAFDELCTKNNISFDEADAVVLSGNTAMMYLFCGLDVSSIAYAPFHQDTFFGGFMSGAELSLNGYENARVYIARSISAYVGGDITAALIASGFFDKSPRKTSLLVDIGTNGEIVLVTDERAVCCSAAAGPAFEGAGIHCGMTAKSGAIYKVRFENGKIISDTIGKGVPVGICGSGITDAVAVMLETGIVDETGRICDEDHDFIKYITEYDEQPAFTLPDTDIIITQKDIRAVQLAKSSICSAILTLLEEAEITAADISYFSIAGGFGSGMDIASAARIGLIPQELCTKAKYIGNAAGAGASMLLLNDNIRKKSEDIAVEIQTVELNLKESFMDRYIENMIF